MGVCQCLGWPYFDRFLSITAHFNCLTPVWVNPTLIGVHWREVPRFGPHETWNQPHPSNDFWAVSILYLRNYMVQISCHHQPFKVPILITQWTNIVLFTFDISLKHLKQRHSLHPSLLNFVHFLVYCQYIRIHVPGIELHCCSIGNVFCCLPACLPTMVSNYDQEKYLAVMIKKKWKKGGLKPPNSLPVRSILLCLIRAQTCGPRCRIGMALLRHDDWCFPLFKRNWCWWWLVGSFGYHCCHYLMFWRCGIHDVIRLVILMTTFPSIQGG